MTLPPFYFKGVSEDGVYRYFAELIAGNSPFGVWMTKEVMWSNLEIPSLRAGIDIENRTQIMASGTEDSRAAMGGFLRGETPDWQNR